jgi:hypothetical protein
MATVSKSQAYHGALTANTVDTVTISGLYGSYRILCRENVANTEIYFTVSQGSTPTAPTVAGDNTYVIPALDGQSVDIDFKNAYKGVTISLIAGSGCKYSVMGLGPVK